MCTSMPAHPRACVCACAQCIHYMWTHSRTKHPVAFLGNAWNFMIHGMWPGLVNIPLTNAMDPECMLHSNVHKKKIQKVHSYEWCPAFTLKSITFLWNSPSANNCHSLVEWQPGNEIVWACCRGDNSMTLIDHLRELACLEWSSSVGVHVPRGKCGRDGRVVKQSA